MENSVRWSLVVTKETDLSLRAYLGRLGLKKGSLSQFVEDAVRWRVMDQMVSEVKAQNAGISAAELDNVVNDAVRSAREANRVHARRL